MKVPKNTNIRLLREVPGIPIKYKDKPENIAKKHMEWLEKYEVVTVLGMEKQDNRKWYHVRNVLDQEFLIPDFTLFKIVGKSREKSEVKAASTIQLPPTNAESRGAQIRSVQKMQVVASNMLNCDNMASMAKYIAAAVCADMAVTNGLDHIYSNKLLALCTRLIESTNRE